MSKLKKIVPRSFWPYLGALRRFPRTLSIRTDGQRKKLMSDSTLGEDERKLLSRVNSLVYGKDAMYPDDGSLYFKVGLSAIKCIDEALESAHLHDRRNILDLPCGGGRVMRFLAQRFPDAEITACELEAGLVDFCVRTFGAMPAYSSRNLDEVSLGREFDLIWCGSLITHLNETGIVALLRLFRRHLTANGIMIFSTHGDFASRRIPGREFDYGLTDEKIDRIGVNYPETGYGFEDYPGEDGYGVSITSPDWIRARVREVGGLREVYFKERGWDDHQDVFGFVRA